MLFLILILNSYAAKIDTFILFSACKNGSVTSIIICYFWIIQRSFKKDPLNVIQILSLEKVTKFHIYKDPLKLLPV